MAPNVRPFDSRTVSSRLTAKGRIKSNLERVSTVRPDLWERIFLVNSRVVSAEIKETPPIYIYDLRIFQTKKVAVRQSSANAERRCRGWLVTLMKNNPDAQEHERAWYFEDSKRQFGVRSKRSFDRAVGQAKALVPHAKWFRRGGKKSFEAK